MESPLARWKTEWWFKDSLGRDQRILLEVDEDSTEEEIENEMEYWMSQASGLPDCPDKKAIMSAIRWMSLLAS
jgi:hypothetical protein